MLHINLSLNSPVERYRGQGTLPAFYEQLLFKIPKGIEVWFSREQTTDNLLYVFPSSEIPHPLPASPTLTISVYHLTTTMS